MRLTKQMMYRDSIEPLVKFDGLRPSSDPKIYLGPSRPTFDVTLPNNSDVIVDSFQDSHIIKPSLPTLVTKPKPVLNLLNIKHGQLDPIKDLYIPKPLPVKPIVKPGLKPVVKTTTTTPTKVKTVVKPKVNYITGKVVGLNGEPLVGASVYLEDNSTIGTSTDFDGFFTLKAPENKKVVVSFMGYHTKVFSKVPKVIQLIQVNNIIDEVDLGTIKKKKKSNGLLIAGIATLAVLAIVKVNSNSNKPKKVTL